MPHAAQIVCFLSTCFLVSVAGGGAFVWIYNRTLSMMHESMVKKVVAIIGLPLACAVGVLAGGRVAFGAPGGAEAGIWTLFALAGLLITGRYARLAWIKRGWQRGSRFEDARPDFGAIRWSGLLWWGRPLLYVLAPINGVGRLRIHRRTVRVPGLDPAFNGYRIVHLTDFHIHKTLVARWYRHVVDCAMAEQPDVILYGGDFISKPPHIPDIPPIMQRLAAPDGVYFVRGNHDFWKSPQRIARLAQRAGMRLLSNEGVIINRDEARVALIGLETPYISISPAERDALERLPRPRIGLVHTPDAFAEAARLGCAVAFAGHTHGGQVRLPLFGTTVSSTGAEPAVASGIGRLGRMLTITSNGQGAFFPLRVMCPPEIVVVELKVK